MKQYLIELKDKLHIATAELRRERTGKVLRPLKPDGEDVFLLEREDCSDYWEWLKREKSIVPGDEVDICFLFPAGETGEAFRKAAHSLNARLLPETQWTKSEIDQYLQATKRRLRGAVPAADSAFSVLMLAGGTKLYAAGFNGQGLKQPEEIPAAPAFAGSCDRSPAHAAGAAVPKASARHRPKAFPAAAAGVSAPPPDAAPAFPDSADAWEPDKNAGRSLLEAAGVLQQSESVLPGSGGRLSQKAGGRTRANDGISAAGEDVPKKNAAGSGSFGGPSKAAGALPPATPAEIQAGINYIIRSHCRTTDLDG